MLAVNVKRNYSESARYIQAAATPMFSFLVITNQLDKSTSVNCSSFKRADHHENVVHVNSLRLLTTGTWSISLIKYQTHEIIHY